MDVPDGAGQKHASDAATDLFFGTIDDAAQYESCARGYCDLVKASESIRLIVIETWLFLDYSVRCLLMKGLDLHRFDHEDIDLRYTLLPRSLVECLSLLQKLRSASEGLPTAPEQPFRASINKLEHFDRFEPGLTMRIFAAEESYHNSCGGPYRMFSDRTRYRALPEGWLEVAARVDESWMRRANQLNSARNLAAHCHDGSRIAAKLGFCGPEALGQVRGACLGLANDLAGLGAFLQMRFTRQRS